MDVRCEGAQALTFRDVETDVCDVTGDQADPRFRAVLVAMGEDLEEAAQESLDEEGPDYD